MENNKTIKFYANFNSKQHKYFISGKNEKNKYYSLWKSDEFNPDFYFDTNLFKNGQEIEKSKLKLLKREDGEESKVLVFKDGSDELVYCVSKAELEKRKSQQKSSSNNVKNEDIDLIFDIIKELCVKNSLELGELATKVFSEKMSPDAMEEIDDDNLPF